MNNQPQIYHGEWWVPAVLDPNILAFCKEPRNAKGLERVYSGTLTYYGSEDSTLELYLTPSNFFSNLYHQINVIWGRDSNGHIFTLFNVAMKRHSGDFSKIDFVVNLVLIGAHVHCGDEALFNKCVVQFPYLRNWAFQDMIKGPDINLDSFSTPTPLLETKLEEGIWWRLQQYQPVERTIHDLTITQTTEFEIETTKSQSIKWFLTQIEAFSQFLSIALFCDQNFTSIKFDNDYPWNEKILLCKKQVSETPGLFSLIKFDLLKDKLPSMLKEWYMKFERVAPITSYLIQSLQRKNRFEVPDFLIIAQSLDGYFKRFENKKDGKDHHKYEDGIKILLEQFEDVECIQKCNIKPKVLKDSRDYYSHLYPDEEKKSSVDSEDLYWLTEKCKVLLTCCILNMIGLTNEDINKCCEQSPISQIIDSLPPE